jgi:antitoxin (DNA-binding transcriptional repressor) of toxin-antitoxin stability system
MQQRWAIVALAVLWLLQAAGCGRGAVHVASVRVAPGPYAEQLSAIGLGNAALADATRDGLVAAGFRMGEGKRTYRARLEVIAFRAGRGHVSGAPTAEIEIDLELVPARPQDQEVSLVETGFGAVPAAAGLDARAWRQALSEAVRQATTGLSLALSEEVKPVGKLVADLDSPDPRVREQAIRVLGDQRSAQAVPALIARLQDPERALRERAAGALAQIRDLRAVGPLIEHSRAGEDGAETARYARIIGDIGGSEARGYLETLESGDPDPRVRASAHEALADMASREREEARVAQESRGDSPAGDSGRMAR